MRNLSVNFVRPMLAAISLCAWSPTLYAQQTHGTHVDKSSAEGEGWRVKPGIRLGEKFDDNPYLLSDAGRAGVSAPSASSLASGRYSQMFGPGDYITRMRGSLSAEGPGFLGRRLTLAGDARYDFYHSNSRRRNMAYQVRMAQSFGHGTHLGARAALRPTYFFRNFLADAVDANGDGTIQSSERIYAPAIYSQQEVAGVFRQRLVKSTRDHPFGLEVTLEGGHETRAYDQPFATRGYRGPFAAAIGAVELTPRARFEGEYRRASLGATPGTTVLLLNEPDFNQDFNGNGTTTDVRVRSVQMVDFSRTEQIIGGRFRARMSDAVETTLSYAGRLRNYESKLPYDVYNNTRHDRRDRLGVEVAYRFTPKTLVHLGGSGELQKLTKTLRPTVPMDGITAYTRKGFYISWSQQL